MARTKAVLGTGARLGGLPSASLLACAIPAPTSTLVNYYVNGYTFGTDGYRTSRVDTLVVASS